MISEKEFWDSNAERLKKQPFLLDESEKYVMKLIGSPNLLLDCGVGIGKTTAFLTKLAKNVVGIDISYKLIKIAKNRVKFGYFCQMDIHNLGFKNNVFNIVFGSYILHHTEIKKSIPEIYRVIKNNGKAIFIENFAFNPIINFCRKYLVGRFGIPKYSSPKDKPLNYKDIKLIKKYFEIKIIQIEFRFFIYLARQIFKFRYKFINNFCDLLDRCILKGFSELVRYSYVQVLLLKKKL